MFIESHIPKFHLRSNSKSHIRSSTAMAIAAALIALPLPIIAQSSGQPDNMTQSSQDSSQSAQSASANSPGTGEAAKMVSATAIFTSTVDSQKMPPGTQFRAKLQHKVRLDNGPELPAGTILVGSVVDDNSQPNATAKLALLFTEADLKNGQAIPIKATIVNVYHAPSDWEVGDEYSPSELPLGWNGATLGVDQIGVLSGVDLHSRIASPVSGVFISTKKSDIKLSSQTGLELAIAPQGNAQTSAGGE